MTPVKYDYVLFETTHLKQPMAVFLEGIYDNFPKIPVYVKDLSETHGVVKDEFAKLTAPMNQVIVFNDCTMLQLFQMLNLFNELFKVDLIESITQERNTLVVTYGNEDWEDFQKFVLA